MDIIIEQPTSPNEDEGIDVDYDEDSIFKACCSLFCEKTEFITLMESAMDPYIRSCTDHKKFDWGCVSKFFEKYKTKLTHKYRLRIFCAFLLKLFVDFDCGDITLIRKAIYMYHQIFLSYKRYDACYMCRYAGNQKHFRHEEKFSASPILENLNKKIPPCFYFDNRKFYSELTVDAIQEGDFILLKFLVKYGLSYFPTDLRKHTASLLKNLCLKYCIKKGEYVHILDTRGIEEQCDDILQRCTMNSEESNLRKLFMTILTVNIAICKNFGDKYYTDYAQCLTLFAETVPDSPISLMDVENFLSFAFSDPFFIIEMCSEVKEVFSGIKPFPTPRSLKFLCRCKIRNYVGSKMFDPFTYILSETNIASSIVKYLLIV